MVITSFVNKTTKFNKGRFNLQDKKKLFTHKLSIP